MLNIVFAWEVDRKTTIGKFLHSKLFSPSSIYQEIKAGNVFVDEVEITSKNVNVYPGERVVVILNHEKCELPINPDPIEVLYEDDYFLLINKPKNLLSEPYKLGTTNNLASMIANYFKEKDIESKVHLVNRLDRETNGIIIVAKNAYIKTLLANTEIEKKYIAKVEGKVEEADVIHTYIWKKPNSNSRCIAKEGKESITEYKRISYDEKDDSSIVEVTLKTGRTHQIRVSFASIGHPLVGDKLYGSERKEEMQLTAYYTKFHHPHYDKDIEIKLKAR